jgi:hypothetical protein
MIILQLLLDGPALSDYVGGWVLESPQLKSYVFLRFCVLPLRLSESQMTLACETVVERTAHFCYG